MNPKTLIEYPEIKEYIIQKKINQYEIKLYDHPDQSDLVFEIGYLDMSFEHEVILSTLERYIERIKSYRDRNRSAYFKLNLLLSKSKYKELEDAYQLSQSIEKKSISFETYVLKELGLSNTDTNLCLLIKELDEIMDIGRHVSNYMMGYWYYLNHGRR
jgi:adenylosuccinate lyase